MSSGDKLPYIGVGTVTHYGGSPLDSPWDQVPRVQPYPPVPDRIIERVFKEPAPKRKITVAARVDEYGQLWLRLSVDGVHLAEVAAEGSSVTLTEEI